MAVIFGTDANDTLTGGDENDSIFGRAGDDTLSGLKGDDSLFSEAGNDTINGNDGNDFLDGGDSIDRLNGGNGDDLLFAGADNDVLLGEDGNDRLFGGAGNDISYGGNGNDILLGEGEDDSLFGGDGNDILLGADGNDRLDGAGAQNNRGDFTNGSGTIDVLTGEVGQDTFVLGGAVTQRVISPYYLGGGNSDYALITDFNKSEDVIQLQTRAGRASTVPFTFTEVEYSLGASPEGLPPGTGIYVNNLGTKPDLIGILQGVEPNSVSLTESYFKFV